MPRRALQGRHKAAGLCGRHHQRLRRALRANPGADKARLIARWQREEIADAAERDDIDLLAHFIDRLRAEAREPLARIGTPAELPDDRETVETCRRMNLALECDRLEWVAIPYSADSRCDCD